MFLFLLSESFTFLVQLSRFYTCQESLPSWQPMRFFRRPPNVRHVKLICSEPRQSQPWQKTLLQRLLTVQAQILFTKINWRLDSSWQSTNLEKIEFCFVMITMWPACLQHSLQMYNINWLNKSFFYKNKPIVI